MPSDERVIAALEALKPQIEVFRFALNSTLERAKTMLTTESGPGQVGAALGNFANGRIDPARFAMISSGSAPLDTVSRSALERAVEHLETVLLRGDDAFVVVVPSGSSPGAAIRDRLAELGAVFGAASLVEVVRRRAYDPARHHLPIRGNHPFERWTSAERRLAPPLIVALDGSDLDPFELAPLLDGRVRIVLLVNGISAPAPLARIISPGVFVAQTDDEKGVGALTDLDAPAIVAIMTGEQARFTHDPAAGIAMWQRLQVSRMPAAVPRRALGRRSAWQQRDDVAHLDSLSKPPLPLASPAGDGIALRNTTSDPAELLATWLLDQSNLSVIN